MALNRWREYTITLMAAAFPSGLGASEHHSANPVGSSSRQNDGDDKAKEADSLSEDEDEDHADEELGLNGVHADADVSHDTDGKTGSLKPN